MSVRNSVYFSESGHETVCIESIEPNESTTQLARSHVSNEIGAVMTPLKCF